MEESEENDIIFENIESDGDLDVEKVEEKRTLGKWKKSNFENKDPPKRRKKSSPVWGCFSSPQNFLGKTRAKCVIQTEDGTTCGAQIVCEKGSTSALISHVRLKHGIVFDEHVVEKNKLAKYLNDPEKYKQNCSFLLLKWFARQGQPFKQVEDANFKEFIGFVSNGKYTPPSSDTLNKNMDIHHIAMLKRLGRFVDDAGKKNYSILFDDWTGPSQHIEFLGSNICFVDNDWKLQTIHIGIKALAKADTAGCKKKLEDNLKLLGLNQNNCRLGVGDGNAVVGATFRSLKINYLWCVPHFIDNEAKNCMHRRGLAYLDKKAVFKKVETGWVMLDTSEAKTAWAAKKKNSKDFSQEYPICSFIFKTAAELGVLNKSLPLSRLKSFVSFCRSSNLINQEINRLREIEAQRRWLLVEKTGNVPEVPKWVIWSPTRWCGLLLCLNPFIQTECICRQILVSDKLDCKTLKKLNKFFTEDDGTSTLESDISFKEVDQLEFVYLFLKPKRFLAFQKSF